MQPMGRQQKCFPPLHCLSICQVQQPSVLVCSTRNINFSLCLYSQPLPLLTATACSAGGNISTLLVELQLSCAQPPCWIQLPCSYAWLDSADEREVTDMVSTEKQHKVGC